MELNYFFKFTVGDIIFLLELLSDQISSCSKNSLKQSLLLQGILLVVKPAHLILILIYVESFPNKDVSFPTKTTVVGSPILIKKTTVKTYYNSLSIYMTIDTINFLSGVT